MKKANCTWSKTLVSVCTKCHAGIDAQTLERDGNSGENLKDFLKAQLRSLGHAGACRVINSSCLGLCPVGEQAILVQSHLEAGEMLAVHPENEREVVLDYLIKKVE